MAYENYMLESIKKVEVSRAKRLNETYSRLTAEEIKKVLNSYHPDYKKECKCKFKFGVSKGENAPKEFIDLIEAQPLIIPERFDLNKIDYDTDVLIIGGGGAASAAALFAHENGAKVLMATKLRIGDANTMMAQGGIQAADKQNDSPMTHYLDVMGGGHYANSPELVKSLVMDAPFIINWHEKLGVMYVVAQIIATGIVTVLNFLINKHFIFVATQQNEI